ncbi:ANK domain containing protein [uncultured Caudovirales phage]|uniref:ANK domain containing protein n=1 Tax=uncultured Caudovirales phage TaxID=2100421 RepID=A0A6J5TAB6_9CAUD|nr:ANK domain containing protein [uncultured Caudovirales phage]CAB4241104.1 ANK domain containing protein [uncultured Caudovirales phage]
MNKETLEELGSNLEMAIWSNHTWYIKQLILEKIDLNRQYGNRDNALSMAVSLRRNKIVKLLIDYGVNLDVKNKGSGETAFMIAVKTNNVELVKLLIEKGANVNLREKSKDWTPLMFSICNMRDSFRGRRPQPRVLKDATEITKLLLNIQDIDVYFKGCEQFTALFLAQPFPEIVEIINNRFFNGLDGMKIEAARPCNSCENKY